MSANDPINLKQDRRQWLKASATVLSAAVLPLSGTPEEALPVESQSAQTPSASAPQAAGAEAKSGARFFTPAQHALIE